MIRLIEFFPDQGPLGPLHLHCNCLPRYAAEVFFFTKASIGRPLLRLLVNEISSPLLIFMSWLCRVGWDSILVSVSIRTKLEQ